jgi:hypothetical protein
MQRAPPNQKNPGRDGERGAVSRCPIGLLLRDDDTVSSSSALPSAKLAPTINQINRTTEGHLDGMMQGTRVFHSNPNPNPT